VTKKLLDEHGLPQTQVAKLLGTSQSNISYYLHSKRGARLLDEISDSVDNDVATIANWMVTGDIEPKKLMARYCEICKRLRRNGIVCKVHREHESMPLDCDLCLEVSV